MRGSGRAECVATLLLIGCSDQPNPTEPDAVVGDTRLVFTNLHTYGWTLILLGVVQLTGGLSLMGGNTYGRVIGIIGAGLGAIDALGAIGGKNPWWSLGVFALCVYILYGLIVFGHDVKAEGQQY